MAGVARAATINVASPLTLATAQAAYDLAAPSGDTIVFPLNATSTWSSPLMISKAVSIVGNGTTLVQGSILNTGFFYLSGITSSSLMRITGFTFNLIDFTPSRLGIAMNPASVALTNLRIDHNTFRFGYTQINCYGAKGVIDHNYFYNSLKAIDFAAGTTAQATASWVSMAAGTGDALFIEDNHFIDDASYPASYEQEKIGTENGGKLVVRYNDFDSDNISALMAGNTSTTIHTHGNAPGGVPANQAYWEQGYGARRGQSVVEIYHNTMHGKRIDFMAILRGSANLVWSNSLSETAGGGDNSRFYLREEESTDSWSPSRTTWPAEDQVHNSFFWDNTFQGNAQTIANFVTGDIAAFIQENRDFFLHAPQSSGGKESFTGANGASGGYPTDGVLYPTLGTMTFSAAGANAYYPYTPYTYPYPSVTSNPTISAVANQTTAPDTSTGPIAFTVGDPVDPASSLTVGVTSSNHTLADDADCVLGGSGSSRTVTITPNAGQTGSTTIKLIVTNLSLLTATNTFTLTVGSPAPVVVGNGKLKGNRGRLK